MAGPFHIIEFLGSLGPAVGVFAEFSGVGLITGDEQQGTGRNGLDILERIEVHELHIAGVGGMGGGVHILPFACCRTPGGPVEIVEFLLDGIGLLIQGMGGSPQQLPGCPFKFRIPLPGRIGNIGFPLFQGLGMMEPVPVGRPHVVHGNGGDGLDPGIDLGGADDETAAAAYPQSPDVVPVHEIPGPQIIHGGHVGFGINVRQHTVPGRPFTGSPVRRIHRQGYEALVRNFLGIESTALFLHGPHGMAHDHRRQFLALLVSLGNVQVPGHLHVELVLEGHRLPGHLAALVEIVRPVVRIPGSRHYFGQRSEPRIFGLIRHPFRSSCHGASEKSQPQQQTAGPCTDFFAFMFFLLPCP